MHPESYDVVAWLFFGGRRRRVFTRLAALSGARPGDQVLDVGCGTGYLTRIMAAAVGPGGAALGVDPSAGMIAKAAARNRLLNCTFTEGSAEALDAADGTFDVVVSTLVVHHIPEDLRAQAAREILRVLRPGGRVLLGDFRPPSTALGRRVIGRVTSPAMEHNAVHLLEPLVRDAGFQDIATGDVRPWIRWVRGVRPAGADRPAR